MLINTSLSQTVALGDWDDKWTTYYIKHFSGLPTTQTHSHADGCHAKCERTLCDVIYVLKFTSSVGTDWQV